MICQEAYQAADEVCILLEKQGVITTAEDREAIALELFEDGLLQGSWDMSMDVQGKYVRVINEDEYDQHMDYSDDKPKWNKMAGSCSLGYVWIE